MENITAIIFDFGGVLLNLDFDRLTESFKTLGVENFEEMYSQAKADPVFNNLETGKINETDFYATIKSYINNPVTDAQIEETWNSLLLDYRKESLEEVTRLRSKYFCILLSNTNSIHLREFSKTYNIEIGPGSIDQYFDKVYYSHIIGSRKPDAACYEYILKENNLKPEQTLLIDDSIQNIEGAKAIGIQTIHLKTGMKVEDLGL